MSLPAFLISTFHASSPRTGVPRLAGVFLLLALLCSKPGILSASSPFAWDRTYGVNTREYCSGGFPTEDGGSILYGTTYRTDGNFTDIDIIEIDPEGRQIAEHILHRAGNDLIGKMIPTPDGGYLLCGTEADSFLTGNYYRSRGSLMKLDANFNLVWKRLYGNYDSYLTDVGQLPDGRIVAVGSSEYGWMLVCDDEGRAYVSAVLRGYSTLVQLELLENQTVLSLSDDDDYWMMDMEANILWASESGIGYLVTTNMVRTTDGCFVRAASSRNSTYRITKVNPEGQFLYERTVNWEHPHNIERLTATDDGGIATVGGGGWTAEGYEYCFMRFNSDGDLIATKDTIFQQNEADRTSLDFETIYPRGDGWIAIGTSGTSAEDMARFVYDSEGAILSFDRYGEVGGTRWQGTGIIQLSDGHAGVVYKSDLNRNAQSWPEIMIMNEQGDSLGVIYLPNTDHSYETISLIPSYPNPDMEQPGWIFSGIYSADWEHFNRSISLLNQDFEVLWSVTMPYIFEDVTKLTEDVISERNGNVLLLTRAQQHAGLHRIDYRGNLTDSLVAQEGPFYSVVQLSDDCYAVLSDECEVLLVNPELRIYNQFNAGIPNWQNTSRKMISTGEDELLVLFSSLSPQGRDSVYLSKMNGGGEFAWQRSLDSFIDPSGIENWLITPAGRMFFCSFNRVLVYDLEGNFEGRANLSNGGELQWWTPEKAMIGFGLAPEGGLYCCGTRTWERMWVGELTLDSLGIGNEMPEGIAGHDSNIPASINLSCWPNPFNSKATLSYQLSKGGMVRLELYDTGGRLAQTLVNGMQQAGEYMTVLESGSLAGGIYLLRLSTAAGVLTRKVVLQR